MWIDESLSFFFRRLTFSPDGNLLVVPGNHLLFTHLFTCLLCCLCVVLFSWEI